jgi:hypothetical protein
MEDARRIRAEHRFGEEVGWWLRRVARILKLEREFHLSFEFFG